MSRVVLDASALMAVLNSEPGAEMLTPQIMSMAATSTVNLAEVHAKLLSRGWTSAQAWEDATSPVREVIPFESDHARITGDLSTITRTFGLSLGDRACLALGMALQVPVYTAEQAWKKLKLDLRIHLIR